MLKSHTDIQDLPDGYSMTELGPLPGEGGRNYKEQINYGAQEV